MNPRFLLTVVMIVCLSSTARSQFLIDMIDTTQAEGKGLYMMYNSHDHLSISGYMQPQFQWGQEKGQKSYNGGDFAPYSDSRFMLRRGRIKLDYAHFTNNGLPVAQVVFQFDGTERGVFIRDFYGRFFENKFQLFTATTGMFARPFGYEVNLSSMSRETPERGRMSQILMKTERDLGFMVSMEPRRKNHPLRFLKFDLGVFNGEGLTAPNEYDSYKDLISRLSLKPFSLSRNVQVSGGLSLLQGGLVQNNQYVFTQGTGKGSAYTFDSSQSNIGAKAPRKYYGADIQTRLKHGWGNTEFRAEYWGGTQTGRRNNSETPSELLGPLEPYYIRPFNGAFIYLLQNIVNKKHQLGVKYDWYDPNTSISGNQVGAQGVVNGQGDVKYSTVTFGYNFYMTENTKIMLWYDIVRNEHTSLPGYTTDVRDNVFTCRVQFKF
ncbi:MAG TPA: hypothetical protein VLC28_05795 [Flavitalea sp.]|nr:hypothetical protein [Flavitalea sp.]